jgi:hypothetical protein
LSPKPKFLITQLIPIIEISILEQSQNTNHFDYRFIPTSTSQSTGHHHLPPPCLLSMYCSKFVCLFVFFFFAALFVLFGFLVVGSVQFLTIFSLQQSFNDGCCLYCLGLLTEPFCLCKPPKRLITFLDPLPTVCSLIYIVFFPAGLIVGKSILFRLCFYQ